MTNLAQRLVASASADPDAIAVRLDDRALTYGQLLDSSTRLATLLTSRGLVPGDRVGIMLPNVPDFPIAYYGLLFAGGVAVPMNPLLMEGEVAHYLTDSDARFLLAWDSAPGQPAAGAKEAGTELISIDPATWQDSLAQVTEPLVSIVERADSDTAVLLYTSGTTGKPKGAELTHANLRRNADVFATEWLKLTRDDVVLGCLPFFHTFGQTCAMNCAVFSGATLTLIARFDPEAALKVMQRDGATVFLGVPTMYTAILAADGRKDFDTSSLRLCVSGGAALPVEVLTNFQREFDCALIEGYGLSETSPVACFNPPDGVRKAGSVGIPIDGVEMRILDDDGAELAVDAVGEIAIRGHNIMKGYLNRPEATAEVLSADGWFRTGDLGRKDADGYYFIVDRKKSLIIRGGFNIYPREIEDVIYTHPAVHEAAVVGIPHSSLGEEVGAAVVLAKGADVTPEELRDFMKSKVAAYKYPRIIWLVDELPKGPTGKILHRQIKSPQVAT